MSWGKFDIGACCCDDEIIVRPINCSVVGIPGLTITIYEADGTTVHDSGVSDGSGNVTFTGVSGTRRITVTGSARYVTFDAFVALSTLTVVSLTLAAGYRCTTCCPGGIPDALTLVFTPVDTPTVTWDNPIAATITWDGTRWAGTMTACWTDYAGHFCLPAFTCGMDVDCKLIGFDITSAHAYIRDALTCDPFYMHWTDDSGRTVEVFE